MGRTVLPQILGAVLFLIALYFVIKKAIKDALPPQGNNVDKP